MAPVSLRLASTSVTASSQPLLENGGAFFRVDLLLGWIFEDEKTTSRFHGGGLKFLSGRF